MKKLKLNLEDLKVESFETTDNDTNTKGTVVGNSGTCHLPSWYCMPDSAPFTCVDGCDDTSGGWTCDCTSQYTCEGPKCN